MRGKWDEARVEGQLREILGGEGAVLAAKIIGGVLNEVQRCCRTMA
jgi:hypothetical protein